MTKRVLGVAMSAAMLASCSGGSSSNVPSGPHTPTPSSVKVTVLLDGTSGAAAKRRPAYISPATQSVTIGVNGATPVAIDLLPSSSACTPSASGANLVCTLVTSAPAGTDTFTFASYDGVNGSGHKLSENTAVQTISATSTNTLPVTLEGVPAGILVAPYPNQGSVVAQGSGYVLTGPAAVQFAVVALDAGNNLIIGPGAPSLSVTSSSANLAVAPVAGNPNEFTLTPKTEDSSVTLAVTATGGAGGSASSSVALALQAAAPTSLPVSLYAYEAPNAGSQGEIDVFPPGSVGNAGSTRLTSTALDPAGGVVAADANGTVYASGTSSGAALYSVVSFSPTSIGPNATPATEVLAAYKGGPFNTAGSMVVGYDHRLYVNASVNGGYGIFILQPGATGTAAGQYQSIAGSATTLSGTSTYPDGIAVDAAGFIYVGILSSSGPASIAVFAPGAYGNVAPVRVISGANVVAQSPIPIGAAADGTLYVLDYASATVYVFAPGANGNVTPIRSFQSPAMPYHGPMAVDTNGNVYALNESSATTTNGPYPVIVFGAYSAGIVNPLFSIAGSNTNLGTPNGIAVPL